MKFLLTLATVLTMAFMLTAAAVSFGAGVPAAVHYIDHEKVTAVMSKGGPIVSDPGLLSWRTAGNQARWNITTTPTTFSSC